MLVPSLPGVASRKCDPSDCREVDTCDYDSNGKCAKIVDIECGARTEAVKLRLVLKISDRTTVFSLDHNHAPESTACKKDGKADLVYYDNNVALLAI